MKNIRKIATIMTIALAVITLLLPSYSTIAHAATINRTSGNSDTETTIDDHTSTNSSKSWIKGSKKYLPFTDSYLSSKKYETFLRKVSTQKTIKTKKVGKLSTKNLRLSAKLNNDKLIIKITNTGKKKLTDVRLYCFQDNGMMRIFVDSSENQIAYTELKTADYTEVLSAEMETASIGLEDISAKYLTSTNGERIGADGNGKIAAGETVTVTANVSLATSLPIPTPEEPASN